MAWGIKIRKVGAQRFAFIADRNGATNHLRVHALRWPTQAAALDAMHQFGVDNPGHQFRIANLNPERVNLVTPPPGMSVADCIGGYGL